MMDNEALDAIQDLLDGVEWTPDTLDAIARIVIATGRRYARSRRDRTRGAGVSTMNRYVVVAAYLGECCLQPHAQVYRVDADGADQAEALVKRYVESTGCDVGDCFAWIEKDQDEFFDAAEVLTAANIEAWIAGEQE